MSKSSTGQSATTWRDRDRKHRTEANRKARERKRKRQMDAMFQWMSGKRGW